jgi:type VI secretion system protein ImpL
MMAQPRQYKDLLELFYICLALGYEGRYRGSEGGRLALTQIRTRLHGSVIAGRAIADGEVSAHWRGAGVPLRRRWLERVGARVGLSRHGRASEAYQPATPEVAKLRERFDHALDAMRRARFISADGSRRGMAELPWYLFIGAPGSGKTTALLHAGLRFPLGDAPGDATLHRAGGTRDCDWWLTEEAVLLDTAGRYTTDDTEADRAAWLGFLDLLKLYRPREPLHGVVAALSVYDLLHWNDDEITRYATQMRERIGEIQARLGQKLPLYLLLTKADLLAGFGEFFAELEPAQRTQVWGFTFEQSELHADTGRLRERCDEELELLERRLYALLPARLQEERDLQRRGAMYRFPQQFRGLRPLIGTFIDAAFGSGWTGERPLFRGAYFASGSQQGSAIDRVVATLSRSFNLERKVQPPTIGTGKSFFLRRLLREVIFAEAGLAGQARR